MLGFEDGSPVHVVDTHHKYGPCNTVKTAESIFACESSVDLPTTSKPTMDHVFLCNEVKDPASAKSFQKTTRPESATSVKEKVFPGLSGEVGICCMHKFWLYETASRFYVVGGDISERTFRLLKLDRAVNNADLNLCEDDIVYTKNDMNLLLDALDDGNKASGGMKLKYSFWGLLGFVRFTGAYYMLLVTKRSPIASLGGHYIYQIDGTELVSLTVASSRSKVDKDPEEARFLGILNNLDLTRSFYFSYSYDITRTLQRNILRERHDLQLGRPQSPFRDHNPMFVWNHHFLRPVSTVLNTVQDWCFPILHGFVDQASGQLPTLLVERR